MAKISKKKSISWKTYVIPLFIITALFALLGYIIISLVSKFFFNHMAQDAISLANNHMTRVSNSLASTKIVTELIDDRLDVAMNIIMKNEENLSNELLENLAKDLNIDRIYWYNPSGEVIYTSLDYLGWQAVPGYPIYDFINSNKKVLFEDIRYDPSLGVYIKYAQSRSETGDFVQVGILADNIKNLTERFSINNLLHILSEEEETLHVHYLDLEENIIYCDNKFDDIPHDLTDLEREAIKRGQPYYGKRTLGDTKTYEALIPIYDGRIKVGTLVIFYSVESNTLLTQKITITIILLLTLIYLIYAIMLTFIVKKNRKIEDLAYRDPSTKIYNKMYLSSMLREILASHSINNKKALFLINCDNLNLIQLLYGYKVLDDVLNIKIDRITQLGIKHEHIFRYSDTIFAIYIDEYTDDNNLTRRCKQMLHVLESQIYDLESTNLLSIKIGILKIDDQYYSADEIFKHIEITINKLRSLTTERYCFFDKIMQEEFIFNETIKEELNKASKNNFADEFYLEYQPQVDLESDKIVGVEALARWNSKRLGYVSPFKFIEIAEENQLIIPFGNWVIETAVDFIKKLEKYNIDNIKVAINISVIQLLEDDFVENLLIIVNDAEINPRQLEIEITETHLMKNYSMINSRLNILKTLGISISLDDFGTGYSSLSRLRDLNLNVLKIDKSFIDNVKTANQEDVFVQGIIFLANQLNLRIIAEGVETEEQKQYLKSNGCNIMQGYLFSKPIPEVDVIRLLKGYE